MKYVFALLAFVFLNIAPPAQAQDAMVVQTCGTLPQNYAPGATRLVTVDTTGKLCGTGGGGGSGSVTSVAAGCGNTAAPSPITTTGTISASITSRTNTTATDTIVSTDCGNVVYSNRATAVAVGIATAGTAGFANGAFFQYCNINVGIATITPTSGLIGGAANYPLAAGTAANPSCVAFQSDGTNYNLITGAPVTATRLVASNTLALATGAIGSAACTSAQTATATGLVTTDVVVASFNGDPTAVTGYVPLTSGMLTIIVYPTADTFNVKVCNNTTGSITPGAITLNLKGLR